MVERPARGTMRKAASKASEGAKEAPGTDPWTYNKWNNVNIPPF